MQAVETTISEANLALPDHQHTILQLIDAYASDAMGDGKPLSGTASATLITGLREHPTTMIFLAFRGTEPVGIAVCFRGFSTFAARTLLNIHDFFVMPAHRGTGVAQLLLAAIEQRARDLGFCKLTLEVLEKNSRARSIYSAAGFAHPANLPAAGSTLFLSKIL